MTARLMLEEAGKGTKYTALVLHGDETSRKQHEDMGFETGWGTVVKQLESYIQDVLMR